MTYFCSGIKLQMVQSDFGSHSWMLSGVCCCLWGLRGSLESRCLNRAAPTTREGVVSPLESGQGPREHSSASAPAGLITFEASVGSGGSESSHQPPSHSAVCGHCGEEGDWLQSLSQVLSCWSYSIHEFLRASPFYERGKLRLNPMTKLA